MGLVAVLAALAIATGACVFICVYTGGFWVGYRAFGGKKEFRRCGDCDGTGVLMVSEQDDGTTRLAAIPKHIRAEVKTGAGGYVQAGQANVTRCLTCGGMGDYFVMTGEQEILRFPFPFPWRR